MPDKFIPSSDREFQKMSANFAGYIERDPKRYMLSEQDAMIIARAARNFDAALVKSGGAGTRTKATLCEKNTARREAEQIIRKYANFIRVNPEIDPSDKYLLHLGPRPRRLRARTCPQTPPEVALICTLPATATEPARHLLRYKGASSWKKRDKPAGAQRIELFADLVAHGTPVPSYPGEFSGYPRYLRSFTKNPFEVPILEVDEPVRIVYWARWCDATGEVSKCSEPVLSGYVGGNADAPALPASSVYASGAQRAIIRRLQAAQLPGSEHEKTKPMLPDLAA